MVRPKQNGLTENELLVMNVLWSDSPLKVAEILEQIDKEPKPAYTSLMTLVSTMTKKGYLASSKQGKAYLYTPLLKQNNIISQEIKKIKDKFFSGSSSDLIVNLVKKEKLSKKEVQEIKNLLDSMEQ